MLNSARNLIQGQNVYCSLLFCYICNSTNPKLDDIMNDGAMAVLNLPNKREPESDDPIEAFDKGYDDGYEAGYNDAATGKEYGKSFDDMVTTK